MLPEEVAILRKISPLLMRAASDIIAKGKPANELQKEADPDVAIRGWELAAICYKARKANHRILGYTYLSGAWTARDAREKSQDPQKRQDYLDLELAYIREAVNFLLITNQATRIEETFMPDGTKIVKENIPQARIFEVMYILAGCYRILSELDESNRFLEQIIYGGAAAQGIVLWFVTQARDLRQSEVVGPTESPGFVPAGEEEAEETDEEEEEEDPDEKKGGWFF